MEQVFLDKLNKETQRLVEEIEDFAATEIQVRPTPIPSDQSVSNVKAVTLIASETGATLLYRDKEAFRPPAVFHELLHLHRYWVEFVPQLLPADDPDGDKRKIANQIENTLEHLIIVPKEHDSGLAPHPYYNETTKKNWENYPWSEITEPWARRKNCLLSWLSTSFLATETNVKALAEQCLRKERLLDEAKKFSDKINRIMNSKEQCISTTVRFLQIPRHEATMVYLDIRRKSILRRAVPEH